jgi:hypothetical protein
MRSTVFALLAVLAFPLSGFAATQQPTTGELSAPQLQTLSELNTKIAVVHELVDRKVITPEQAAAAEAGYCRDAKQIVGHDVTAQEIGVLVSNAQKTTGLGVFWNIVVVVAGILFLLAILGLISYYLLPVLQMIPLTIYELLAYAGSAVLCLSGYLWSPFHLGIVFIEPLWFVVPGALALAGCIYFTRTLHFNDNSGDRSNRVYMGPGFINFPTVLFFFCTCAWSALAVFYSHLYPTAGIPHVLAFSAVIALQAFLGFSVVTMPGCIALGWETDRQVPRSVFSSLLILGTYVAMKLTDVMTDDLRLFETGAIFMGAFVYYLGLLVMSNKWYCWSGKKDSGQAARYVALQVLTIVSGVAALYLGSVFHLGALLGIGGTFFAIYALEKYYEIPWKGVGWAWSLLGVASFLYFIVAFANTHSEFFVWGIK